MENHNNVGDQNAQQIGQVNINQPLNKSEKLRINYLVIAGVILACLIIFGFGGYYFGKQSSSSQIKEEQRQQAPLPVITQSDTTSDWENYTNSNFGVSFKYPGEIFVYEGSPQAKVQYWSNKSNGGEPTELGLDGVWMNLSITKLDNTGFDYWFKKINLDKPGPKTATSSEVLRTISTNGIRGVIYYDLPKPNAEASYAYTIIWLKERTLYKLFLAAFTENNLSQYKNIFNQIIDTFQFTDSQSVIQATPAELVQNYPRPTYWKSVNISNHNISICLPPKWEVDELGHMVFNRDPAYKPTVLWFNKFDYKGGSRRDEYINMKVQSEYEPEKLKNETKVSELIINGRSVLKIAIPSFPEALVFVLNSKLYEVQLASWNLVNDSQSAFLKDVYTVIGCIESL